MTPSRRLLIALLVPITLVLGAMGTSTEAPGVVGGTDAGVPDAGGADEGVSDGGVEAPDAGLELLGLVPPAPVPSRQEAPPITKLKALSRKEDLLARAELKKGRLVVSGKEGEQTLTVDPLLQGQLTRIMQDYQVPYGAAVVIEPATGRVLALAEHSQAQPGMRGLTTRAVFPAASIFKIVTGGALLEAGVSPDEESCFHGGKRRLSERLLEDSERDAACYSLAAAMGKSANVVFAKLTQKYLSAESLRRMAARMRFNRSINFPIPTDISLASIPEDGFELANTGAGFGDVYLSPLHGAALAAASATGSWRDPVIFEPKPGAPMPEPEPLLSPEMRRAMAEMLEKTVTVGTARRIFRERGFRVDNAVGKTGTLADKNPFRDYSWFVGYAPKENPRVAVAAVIVNDPYWRIRATWLGREAMRLGLERMPVAFVPEEPAQKPPPAANVAGASEPAPAVPESAAEEEPEADEALEDALPTKAPTATGLSTPP
jgi:peptidoglycan glycosyltransferase